jgi:hypothetical protein
MKTAGNGQQGDTGTGRDGEAAISDLVMRELGNEWTRYFTFHRLILAAITLVDMEFDCSQP